MSDIGRCRSEMAMITLCQPDQLVSNLEVGHVNPIYSIWQSAIYFVPSLVDIGIIV